MSPTVPSVAGHCIGKFTPASFAKTKAAWEDQVAANKNAVFSTEYVMIFDFFSKCLDYAGNSGNSYAYGIFNDGSEVAEAIVELVYQKDGKKWLKLLNLHLSPQLDVAFSTQDIDLAKITAIFGASVIGTVSLTSTDHPTKVTKLYGRSGTLLAFLKGLAAHIQANVPELSVSIDGRWLVMRPK